MSDKIQGFVLTLALASFWTGCKTDPWNSNNFTTKGERSHVEAMPVESRLKVIVNSSDETITFEAFIGYRWRTQVIAPKQDLMLRNVEGLRISTQRPDDQQEIVHTYTLSEAKGKYVILYDEEEGAWDFRTVD